MTYSHFSKEQKFLLSTHGKLRYINKERGEVIVLRHGIPTSSWLYRKMIDELSRHYRVIAADMLGFGSSDSPKVYEVYAPKTHAQRLLDLM